MLSEASLRLFGLCAGAAIFCYVATGVAAQYRWLVDRVNARSNHIRPTSRAGGAIIIALTSFLVLMSMQAGAPMPPAVAVMALCAGCLGVIDDTLRLSAMLKLVALFIICVLTVVATGPILSVPLPHGGEIILPFLVGGGLSVFFLLAFVNAFNFMDGLNGMSGTVGIIGLALIVGAGAGAGMVLVCLFAAAVLYGFTVRNILSGHIFLGDGGSLALGLFLAGAALTEGYMRPSVFYIFVIAFVPYFVDTGVTLLKRWRAGAALLEAHKDHFYQRLRAIGWSHQGVSATYGALVLTCGGMGFLGEHLLAQTGLWVALAASIGLYSGTIYWMFRLQTKTAEPQS